jgi:hypothetical protein
VRVGNDLQLLLRGLFREPVEGQIHHGRRVERQELREEQPTDDRDPQRPPQLRAGAGAQRQRQTTEKRRQRGHQDRSEAQQTRLVDGVFRAQPARVLGLEREVDQHDRVLFHDADQEQNAHERDHVQLLFEQQEREQRADPRRGQRGEDRQRVDVALAEHAEHDVDRDQRAQDQQRLILRRGAEGLRRALKSGVDAGRETNLLLGFLDGGHRVAQ